MVAFGARGALAVRGAVSATGALARPFLEASSCRRCSWLVNNRPRPSAAGEGAGMSKTAASHIKNPARRVKV